MFGANGTATPDGSLLQLRALDWYADGMNKLILHSVIYLQVHLIFAFCTGPFRNYPQITVYHPNSGNGYAFANIGWSGWIGSITGQILTLHWLYHMA